MYYLKKITYTLLLLFAGTTIYILFRQNIIFMEWLPFKIRAIEIESENLALQLFAYSLPDALWYASLLVFMSMFIKNNYLNYYILCIAIVLPFFLELGQYFNLLNGTFDIFDIIFYFITLIICLWKLKLKDFLLQVFKY
ncbi:hypothetical protein B5G10_10960 [Barnesiella sp. An55]|nr:hypothetical protein B5G10_10960 [Barnesiella sp. An55]